jgi:hypothetical protein
MLSQTDLLKKWVALLGSVAQDIECFTTRNFGDDHSKAMRATSRLCTQLHLFSLPFLPTDHHCNLLPWTRNNLVLEPPETKPASVQP